ncbi:tyrosine-type recombinase/integrase [Aquimarina sp. RZ0]|uniref:tyrosine-type recombinase/integrase n=1 Tax=Aquimarina sp. RZ0 TaxID=2607730 RepID=UPI0011F2151F|nr:tyrosine-type recombinase/integrase [Aquimarina sp. RZ0]KAA1240334.1 tyrosine-type recombinase/integrase [Aquimarina sp. RZ0]
MEYLKTYQNYLQTIGYTNKTIKGKIERLTVYLTYSAKNNILEANHTTIATYYQWLQQQKPHCKAITLHYYMITLRQFYDWLHICNYIVDHPFSKIDLLQPKSDYTRKPIPENKLFSLWKNTLYDYEKLILIFGYGCGLRAKELTELKVHHIDFDRGFVKVTNGKNSKRRSIPLQATHLRYLYQYKIQQGLSPEHTFFTVTQNTIRIYFKQMQERLGWQRPYYSLHHLRHSIASHLVDRDMNIELVQLFLGHSSLQTTQIYVNPIKKVTAWNI